MMTCTSGILPSADTTGHIVLGVHFKVFRSTGGACVLFVTVSRCD